MYPERKNTLWRKITSLTVLAAIATSCAPRTMGYVTPTPEGGTTPAADLYCDNHMLTYTPEMGLNDLDPNKLPIISESLVGPTGVGRITEFNIVANPTSEFTSNVKRSAQEKKHEQNIDIAVDKSTVVEFGMQGEDGDLCAPFTMILGEPQPDGTQKAYVGFGVEQIDANGDGNPDLEVLIPPFGGEVDRFMEMGQVDTNPSDSLVHLGTVDTLDPQSISPLFAIDEKTGAVTFIPPFYQGDAQPQQPEVQVSAEGANFVNTSFNPDSNNTPPPDDEITPTTNVSPTPTKGPDVTATPEVAQFNVCAIENYKNCEISVESLLNGEYKKWLESLPPTQFDPNNINDVALMHTSDGRVYYYTKSAPNFTGPNEGKEPFNRDRTHAFVNYNGNLYIVMPIEYFDRNHPEKNQWVITVNNITGLSQAQIDENIKIWKEEMNVTAWVDSSTSFFNPNPDPLVTLTLQKYPNLAELVDKFSDTKAWGDKTALDLEGLILLNYIAREDSGKYR